MRNGEKINKDIYYRYNVFVYSTPENMFRQTQNQRFKEVKDKGKSLYNGKKGEFYILGTNYNGDFVYNVYFPVDIVPDSFPETWNYIYFKSFEDSWSTNYKYIEQKEYMQNSKLLFDKIDLKNNVADSYDLVEYDVTPIKNGLGKFRLNTPSTWKTMGIVTAKRRLKDGSIREIIFTTKPMAVDAKVQSILNTVDNLSIGEDSDTTELEIEFGAKVVNLNKYAKEHHIKELASKIYINGTLIDSISGSKTVNVDKKIKFTVSRDKDHFLESQERLNIEIISYATTEFAVDGIIENELKKIIDIKIAPKKLVPIKIIELNKFMLENEKLVVSPLVQSIKNKDSNSTGIIEIGRYLAVILHSNIKREYIENITVYINNNKINYEVVRDQANRIILKVEVKDNVHVSIATIKTLRDISGSIFEVNYSDVGKRVNIPNEIKIIVKLNVNNMEYKYNVFFDVVDNYIYNINHMYKDNIINYGELDKTYEI